jgi:DNA-binding PadR family transcriptional regulator
MPLVEVGFLTMTDPAAPTSIRQKYQTTNQGIKWLKENKKHFEASQRAIDFSDSPET